ncbi:hypothetical protein BDK51DRAFT_25483 [Blyttiomyces helicus]|uniref:Uncharacterized protein n=1 Tax=Blyttiomyces helicus TaxID=388810 RepID=A0A4P9WN81_9FUNG|nr:hypothetical protein BDK51DRAFT_25483 [Blyttiomyces helicus]|eukprot:RKO93715.1 hypothetical protein BDK51DRAFT_25483 [Blyttiomyces helicus]
MCSCWGMVPSYFSAAGVAVMAPKEAWGRQTWRSGAWWKGLSKGTPMREKAVWDTGEGSFPHGGWGCDFVKEKGGGTLGLQAVLVCATRGGVLKRTRKAAHGSVSHPPIAVFTLFGSCKLKDRTSAAPRPATSETSSFNANCTQGAACHLVFSPEMGKKQTLAAGLSSQYNFGTSQHIKCPNPTCDGKAPNVKGIWGRIDYKTGEYSSDSDSDSDYGNKLDINNALPPMTGIQEPSVILSTPFGKDFAVYLGPCNLRSAAFIAPVVAFTKAMAYSAKLKSARKKSDACSQQTSEELQAQAQEALQKARPSFNLREARENVNKKVPTTHICTCERIQFGVGTHQNAAVAGVDKNSEILYVAAEDAGLEAISKAMAAGVQHLGVCIIQSAQDGYTVNIHKQTEPTMKYQGEAHSLLGSPEFVAVVYLTGELLRAIDADAAKMYEDGFNDLPKHMRAMWNSHCKQNERFLFVIVDMKLGYCAMLGVGEFEADVCLPDLGIKLKLEPRKRYPVPLDKSISPSQRP